MSKPAELKIIRQRMLPFLFWGAALYGVLQLQYVSLGIGHALCGAWGCGPPVAPLIAAHGFWLILLVPPSVKVCRHLKPAQIQLIGWSLLMLGLSGFAVVGLWEIVSTLPHWLPRVPHLSVSDYPPRFLLSVVTLVEVPMIQVTLISLILLTTAQSRTLATNSSLPKSQAAELCGSSSDVRQASGG